jgi:hypothetical protein
MKGLKKELQKLKKKDLKKAIVLSEILGKPKAQKGKVR